MNKRIGIIGAGTAGLHLGLLLRRHGVDTTILTDRTPDQQRAARLPNTVAHHAVTVERERALDVDHWPVEEYGYGRHEYRVGPEPLRFSGALHAPSRAVDYRIYLPRLMEDFAQRGGALEFGRLSPDDLPRLAARFDLLVVCTGRGAFSEVFERDPEYSPFTAPRRALCAGLFTGVAQQPGRAVTFHIAPGAGEMIEIPTWTRGGLATALVIENHFGSALEALATRPYEDDPEGYLAMMLDLFREYYPGCLERIDTAAFDLADGPLDILQGDVTPVVRRGHAVLDDGTLVVSLGDAHATVDPILGQGANMASHAAWVLGEEIVAQEVYDTRFVEHVDRRRADRVLSATRWSNHMMENLTAPTPEFQEFLGALSQGGTLTDEFTDAFNYPERAWDLLASPERTAVWIARHTGRPLN
ncbi:styrene monooxygenase subunit StyA [Nocardiopsis sp. MG754419]|uniref:styrene monooxygenase subunit StyA n=1 Tax=Nocardiopsis sp. MG754419 TaxID=2259865 RepID=UPI001BAB2639|nr:styrene monooxygenase/indole monooxygenase family protein [Nocardiopsis sp. MG754419]MBR8743043.1 monooxygenase [Nocardiopsis sp. MG754419]